MILARSAGITLQDSVTVLIIAAMTAGLICTNTTIRSGMTWRTLSGAQSAGVLESSVGAQAAGRIPGKRQRQPASRGAACGRGSDDY